MSGSLFSNNGKRCVRVFGVHWGGMDLSDVDWEQLPTIGEEDEARHLPDPLDATTRPERQLRKYEEAVQAYRQLATALRAQGLNEEADRYAYRAHMLRRYVLRRQGKLGYEFGSRLLDAVAGYGYKPMRSIATFTQRFFAR